MWAPPSVITGPIKCTASQWVERRGNKLFDRTSVHADHMLYSPNFKLMVNFNSRKQTIRPHLTRCRKVIVLTLSLPPPHTPVYFTCQSKCLLIKTSNSLSSRGVHSRAGTMCFCSDSIIFNDTWVPIGFVLRFSFIVILQVLRFDSIVYCDLL